MAKKYSDSELQQYLFNLGFDLKAESFEAFLPNSFKLSYDFQEYFDRRIRADITAIEGPLSSSKEDYSVTLSRRAFYNIFPERFFHTAYNSVGNVNNMLADYRNRKKEEERTRKFFDPLENEFFAHRVANEKEENKIFESLGGEELVAFLRSIWQTDLKFPKKMAARLLKSIPIMYKISGDIPQLTNVLETILDEKVSVTKETLQIPEENLFSEGPQYLGVNFATSMSRDTYLPKYVFTVGPIKNVENIESYLPSGRITGVIEFFLNYTLPFESDFEVNFCVEEQMEPFEVGAEVYNGRLGISTTI